MKLSKGPENLIFVAGFGQDDKSGKGYEFASAISNRLGLTNVTVVASAPLSSLHKQARTTVNEIILAMKANTLLVGYSGGCLATLLAAAISKLRDILKVLLIYGPINPDEKVPKVVPFSLPFTPHYDSREALLTEALALLSEGECDLSKIVTLANAKDKLVPVAAQCLPAKYQTQVSVTPQMLANGDFNFSSNTNKSLHVNLPIEGHKLDAEQVKFLLQIIGVLIK